MKPASIKKFDLFYLASLAVALVAIILGYDSLLRQANAQLAESGMQAMGSGVLIASVVIGMAFNFLVWFVISILRVEMFKWILVALIIWGVFSLVTSPGSITSFGTQVILSLISTVLSIIALFYLFQPDATAWFAAKYDGDDEPE